MPDVQADQGSGTGFGFNDFCFIYNPRAQDYRLMHPHHQPDITGRFEIHPFSIGGLHVSNVTGSFSLNVKGPAAPGLALNPTSGALPDETEGTAVNDDLVANISGGTKPYTVGVTGLPAGVTAAELDQPDGSVNVVLEGTPAAGSAAGSPYTVAVDVTDSGTAATAAARRPLTVR